VSRSRTRPPRSGVLTQIRLLALVEQIDVIVGYYADPPPSLVAALDSLWLELTAWMPPPGDASLPTSLR